ncbi:PREDICTED: putative late blight resistance protein homolog R1B-14 [Ipomoea nil]|uniref:putative late blight resistance protein homolog R1B-14 n=1 Tax=Ipomoea nil TaxID=35883 RepID=UPI000901FB0E|nr:PREDICTED: putative late blight resistance protein homolog R1B-14 [Ipomoea nil]
MAAVGDAVVGQLVNRLVQVVDENVTFIKEIKAQIDALVDDLTSFEAYLRQASRNPRANDNVVLKDVVDKIRNVVTDAEDAICKYTVERKQYKDKGWLRFMASAAYYAKVNAAARDIQGILARVKKIREIHGPALQALIDDQANGQPAILMAPVVEEVDVVGFDNEAKIIKDRLLGGPNDLTIISIEGMAGLGKTTLTKMVFKDRDLQYEFFTRLWVYVSRTINRKQIFLDILSNFTKNTKEFLNLNEEKLAAKINEYLEGGKYFIVLDDVWTENAWDCLRIAFPNNNKGSRVLVTTRHHNVASRVDSTGNPHKLKFLSNNESWELLEKKVFRKEKCPKESEQDGRRIAIKCHGLPLAIVVIAGVLNKDSTTTEWKRIAQDPYPIINKEDMSYNKLVKISYDNLPYNLKDCFLYLAVFPIGHEIATWKLIRLWIAEGFIPLMEGGYSSELVVTAEKYLKDLVDRNLLMVLKRRADGQTKTCRIHDTLHEFCKTEAAGKNLFYDINGAKPELNKMPRRICVHSTVLDFLNLENKPSSEHVHSFLSFCSNEVEIPTEHLAVIPKSFRLLRVMDVESLKFKLLPRQLYELSHLRYLAVSTELKVLPLVFNKLWNLQTLVFKTSENILEVKADMWSMPKLRHVHSNTSMVLPAPPKNAKNSSGSTDIQTLSTISPSSCTQEILEKTPNLQKLGIRGNLAELMESKGGVTLFDNLQKLDSLENLKLINNALHNNKLRRCPHSEKFPRRLRKMTLSNTTFDWKDLNILSSLEELEVLKLEENAFRGDFCNSSNIVFKQLRYLRIGRTNLVSWKVSKDSFQALKYLILRHCNALETVPSVFGEVESLKVMELFCTNGRAANSAREIQKLKNENQCGFQLSIYPPDH